LPTTTTITGARIADASTMYGVTVTAYPNPFSDNISFLVETKQSGQGSLEVYNMAGQKVKTVFSGYLNAGTQRFRMNVPVNQRSVLFYIFRLGDQKAAGKILHNGSY
jgi:hypothetical protein